MSQELIDRLQKLPKLNTESSRELLYDMVRDYSRLIDLDFDKDVLPGLKDYSFWEVDYLKDSKWGLSLMDAYKCLLDVHRTIQIMGGIDEEVRYLKEHGKKDIVAIDAGTGTGIFAIYLAALGCKKVYALELNEKTADVARKFVDSYGFSDRVEVVVCDATQVDIPELREKPADMLVSENLSGGLFSEPQFQIIKHLSAFLELDAPIVPYTSELSVSLAKGDWDKIDWKDKKPRNTLTMRRVPNLTVLTDRMHYGFVTSEVGMDIPRIKGDVSTPVPDGEFPNLLLISTRFQLNKHGKHFVIEPDSAEFLGKTTSVKLESSLVPVNGMANIHIDYDAGFKIKEKVKGGEVDGNYVKLVGHLE